MQHATDQSRPPLQELAIRSPAKINWTLRVLGRREDGFHEIESLVSAVTLYDDLVFTTRRDDSFRLSCVGAELPTGSENLICRAARLLGEESAVQAGADCLLTKRIPVGGGLGGGSSNAAATLVALNRLWAIDWPTERLAPLAARLGSDVSFFLFGGSAMMTGRGERIHPVKLSWRGWVVLLVPAFPIATADVYRAWASVAGYSPGHSQPECVEGQNAAVRWMEKGYNMLESPARQVCPSVGALLDEAAALAGRPVRLSGSGSTVFTAFDTQDEAGCFAETARKKLRVESWVAQPLESA